MDELLALMDDDVPEEEENEVSSAVPDQREARANKRPATTTNNTQKPSVNRTNPDLDHSRTANNEPQGRVEVSIDTKLGIRMIKRRMSSIDLMDLICTHPYHSTAAISAMSLAALNRLLVEPTSVVSAATVSGKTNIVTVGIVFTNSGTRISANGRAFCIMTIGNLNTGPVASVFLFGEAYSRHCANCPPGTVIALVAPSLLSPKQDSRDTTTVSLSVADPRQFIPVAQARDYSVCKGTVSAKGPNGQWISHGGQCKHHVDVRVSQYCEKHRKQQNTKNGPVKKGLTFVQQQKMEQASKTSVARGPIGNGVMTMQMPGIGTVVTQNPVPPSDNIEAQFEAFKSTSGRFLNAPMHMKKQGSSVQPQLNARPTRLNGASNSRQPQGRAGVPRPAASAPQSSSTTSGSIPVQGDWLNPKSSRSAKNNKTSLTGKRRTVNRDGEGFDGSVAVPKPSKLFRNKTPNQQRNVATNQNVPDETKIESIRQQQRLVAQRQKENTVLRGSSSRKQLAKKQYMQGTKGSLADDALKDSLFGKVSSIDTEQVLNAKSRFADEADAEAYAKSRRIVTDLERREELKTNANKKKQKAAKESAIQKEWVCATCGKRSKEILNLCVRSNHKVSFTRSVKKSDTVQQRRLKLDEKSVQDGGLKLGAGLEWDRRRFQR